MKIREELQHQLAKPSHIVKIEDINTGNRLEKNTKNMRFAYSIDDINEEFGGIGELVEELKNRGFGTTKFLFQRTYGTPDKATYHTMKEVTKNLQKTTKKQDLVTQDDAIPTQTEQSFTPKGIDFLAGANLTGTNPLHYLGALVESQRAGDYRKRVIELEDLLRDEKSKTRQLQEENHSLKLKVETVEEKADLKVQRELLEKESILEKPGTQKVLESIGSMLPHLATMISQKSTPTPALNAPNLSPMQQQAFDLIRQANNEQASLVIYILSHYNEELVSLITKYIQKQQTPTK